MKMKKIIPQKLLVEAKTVLQDNLNNISCLNNYFFKKLLKSKSKALTKATKRRN